MTSRRQAISLTVTATLDSLPRLLDAVDEVSDAAGANPAVRHDLRLAVEEACVNVMRHAYRGGKPGQLTIDLAPATWQGAPAIRVLIQDCGMPFDPLQCGSPQRGSDIEQLPIGGLGIHLMRQMTDSQSYRRDAATGNNLTLVKAMNPPQGEPE